MVGLFVLISYWALGTVFVTWLNLPVPGSVVGLIALWLSFAIYGGVPSWIKLPSNLLIRYLTLMFVPACAGLIEHLDRLQTSGVVLLSVIALSSAITIITVVTIFKLFGAKT